MPAISFLHKLPIDHHEMCTRRPDTCCYLQAASRAWMRLKIFEDFDGGTGVYTFELRLRRRQTRIWCHAKWMASETSWTWRLARLCVPTLARHTSSMKPLGKSLLPFTDKPAVQAMHIIIVWLCPVCSQAVLGNVILVMPTVSECRIIVTA